ncbi:MAG: tRNA (guanosine(46)-N7)-methyltransferase TrmB [Lachnospiraceae bacterium]|nr:tRNA (guanosine(46)-N7)-methyltransferase TrmB [Lachnospiraceae bacterium]
MRLRNVKGAREKIQSSSFTINEDNEEALIRKKGKWNLVFGNDYPIHIEIGMGKGQFLMELAKRNPHINYIGIEKFSSVLVRAIERREAEEETSHIKLSNLFYIRMDAENLEQVFEQNEISRIYLNFSDPWPKERHAKRRLTSTRFLQRYNNILVPDGRICFKTDNRALFDFSLEQIEEAGWILEKVTYDLHHSEYNEGNIMTEYETRFSSEGIPICRLETYRKC